MQQQSMLEPRKLKDRDCSIIGIFFELPIQQKQDVCRSTIFLKEDNNEN